MKKKKKIKQNPWVCDNCGKSTVQVQAWVDVNTNKYMDNIDESGIWCNTCDNYVGLITLREWNERNKKSQKI